MIKKVPRKYSAIQIANPVQIEASAPVFHAVKIEEMGLKWLLVDIASVI